MKKIFIKKTSIYPEYDADILNVSKHADHLFQDHRGVARSVKGKDPYAVIVILENLDPQFWNNKKYVEKTRIPLATLWEELLLKYFFEEFGERAGNTVYGEWLALYKEIWKYEIGYNYALSAKEADNALSGTHYMEWRDFYALQEISIE